MDRTNVAFYLPNKGFKDIDCRNINQGNPGIGGSEYALLTVAKKLSESAETLRVEVVADEVNSLLPSGIKYHEANSLFAVVDYAEKTGIDIIVFRFGAFTGFDSFVRTYSGPVRFVVWCANFVPAWNLKLYANSRAVARLVTVGMEQMDLYRDHAAFNKSDYIYNAIPQTQFDDIRKTHLTPFRERASEVTYVGSIIPGKSFHVLAKAWPEIIKAVPDATLNVIGSGQLYDRNQRLGKFGIAEEGYENSFIDYITENGKILPSVKFWGVLGKEKEKVLSVTKVGVPNPTGNTETFGFTAVELQMSGAVIATQKCPGYLDTVVTPPSVLYETPGRLAESVVRLLNDKTTVTEGVLEHIERKFSLDHIYKDWERLLGHAIPRGVPLRGREIKANPDYRHKRLKESLRKIKGAVPFGYRTIPSVATAKGSVRHWLERFILKRQGINTTRK